VLNPRKAKELIPQVAEELSLPDSLIEDVITYYWQEVRKSLSGLKHNRIHVTNLGDFVTKHWKIDDKINQLEKWEENNKLKGMQELTARFKTAETLFDLKALKKFIEEENQRKDFIKLHTHESKRKHNKNLESKGADSRGDNK
jgi:nucleoid DNA-binding protein